jgi:ABC-type Fe3+ transport system permease subunit
MMNLIASFGFAILIFSVVLIAGLWLAFCLFPTSKPGKTFFRIFIDGDYDGK